MCASYVAAVVLWRVIEHEFMMEGGEGAAYIPDDFFSTRIRESTENFLQLNFNVLFIVNNTAICYTISDKLRDLTRTRF